MATVVKQEFQEEIRGNSDSVSMYSTNEKKPQSADEIMQQRPTGVASTRMSSNSRRVHPIVSLNPYQSSWVIKVRVTNKSPMRSYSNVRGGGSVFKAEFTDEDGTEIEATMWNGAADKFMEVLQMGKVYYISKGNLKVANKKYATVKNDYEMTLDENSVVEEVEEEKDGKASIPLVNFSFVKFEDLGPYVGGRRLVDVIGVLKQIAGNTTVRRKSDGEEIPKREITIADNNNKTVNVTLWGDLVNSDVVREMEKSVDEGPVVALKSLRVGDYQGVSLGSTNRSTLSLNPTTEETKRLKSWFEEGGRDAVLVSAGEGLSGASGGGGGGKSVYEDRMKLRDLTPDHGAEKIFYFNTLLTVTFIKPDQPMYYSACEKCSKKVIESSNGAFWCEGCGQNYNSCKRRYIVSMKACDTTGEIWLTAFNEQAEQMLGMSADKLAEYKDNDDAKYKSTINDATWKTFPLRMSAEVSEYKNEKRQRLRVRSTHNIDWVKESKLLLQTIQEKSQL